MYIEGFVLPLRRSKLKAYVRMARIGERVWRKHGALDYKECVGDDLRTECGLPFPKLLGLKAGETAVFAWITYRSRAHRDRVNAKVMKEMSGFDWGEEMPFDMARMTHGGFRVAVGS